jgi:hypothetical protein
MNGHTRVHICDDGSAIVRQDGTDPLRDPDTSSELRFDSVDLVRAAYKAQECCDARQVRYPIGSEHCPCLACCVDKAHRRWKEDDDGA